MLHPLRWIRRVISLIVLAAAAYYVVSGVQVVNASEAPQAAGIAPRAQAVVVVSAGTASLDADLRLRLRHAAQLRALGRAPAVVVACADGGEARRETAFLVRHGVPAGDVSSVVAPELPAQLHQLAARARGGTGVLVVADSWQTLWVVHVAQSAGLEAAASPVTPPRNGILDEARAVAVQAAAVAWGRIAGFASTGFIAG
ncbi:MAG TPA: hypothetical protein VKU92_00835 [Acidimicrobiales bacterium]|nr:hypothetical protein [Acidimicrobiales bacterium]